MGDRRAQGGMEAGEAAQVDGEAPEEAGRGPRGSRDARTRAAPRAGPRGALTPAGTAPGAAPTRLGARAAGGGAHRCRGLRARRAAPRGSSRTSRRPGGAGRRPGAFSRWSGSGARAAQLCGSAAADGRPRTADGARAPRPRHRPAPPRPAQPRPCEPTGAAPPASFSPLAAGPQAPPSGDQTTPLPGRARQAPPPCPPSRPAHVGPPAGLRRSPLRASPAPTLRAQRVAFGPGAAVLPSSPDGHVHHRPGAGRPGGCREEAVTGDLTPALGAPDALPQVGGGGSWKALGPQSRGHALRRREQAAEQCVCRGQRTVTEAGPPAGRPVGRGQWRLRKDHPLGGGAWASAASLESSGGWGWTTSRWRRGVGQRGAGEGGRTVGGHGCYAEGGSPGEVGSEWGAQERRFHGVGVS